MMKLSFFVLITMLVITSCKPTKIANSNAGEYLVIVKILDGNISVSQVMNICSQLHLSGPMEIMQSNVQSNVLEIKMQVRSLNNDRINVVKDQLLAMTNVVGLIVQRM